MCQMFWDVLYVHFNITFVCILYLFDTEINQSTVRSSAGMDRVSERTTENYHTLCPLVFLNDNILYPHLV